MYFICAKSNGVATLTKVRFDKKKNIYIYKKPTFVLVSSHYKPHKFLPTGGGRVGLKSFSAFF